MSMLAIIAIVISVALLDNSIRGEKSIVAQLIKQFESKSDSSKEFKSRKL